MKILCKIPVSILTLLFFVSSVVFAQSPAPERMPSAVEQPGKISLDLKGMDIVEVLKILALKGNINIVVGPNVRGKVTMFIKDVNVDDAFELILVSNNLARDVRNGITYIMTDKDFELLYGSKYDDKKEVKIIQLKFAKAAEIAKILTQMKTAAGKVIVDEASNTIVIIDNPDVAVGMAELLVQIDRPTETKVFELNYAKAKDIKDRVQEMLTKGIGTAQMDERTNKIAVTDLVDNLARIEAVVTAFDDKLQQVLIEAKIVEITLDDEYKLGVDWNSVIERFSKEINVSNAFKIAAKGTFIPGIEVVYGGDSSSTTYDALVQALKTVGDTNVLSSPRITALNNQEAKILVGSNEPYATNTVTQGTATTTTATSLTFLDIGVKLYVTPTINKDGYITIKIRPEVSSKSGTYTYGTPATTVPIISTTQAETSVTVKNGATIIIAGLIKDERSGTVNKVPILGDIPFAGVAFRNTSNEIQKKELVIFLTPHIIAPDINYVNQPLTEPIGDRKFTMPEEITFDRRKPREMSPGYFTKEPPIEEAEENKIDVKSLKPQEYFRLIKSQIIRNISIPGKGSGISRGDSVTLHFTLYSSGGLVSKPRPTASSNEKFGKIAIDAVEKAAPFPAFPRMMSEAKKTFTLELVYDPGNGQEGGAI